MTTTQIISILLLTLFSPNASAQKYINPEGYYTLIHKRPVKYNEDGVIISRTGSIQVKVLSHDKLVVLIYGFRGAPSYSSGQLVDTVEYVNNTAVCSCVDNSECRITIQFFKKSANIDQLSRGHMCGFGHGVDVNGTYTKTKKQAPNLVDQ